MSQKFEKRKLKNGMTVLYEKRDLPIVALSITNPFGASYEESEIKGIAHVMEHLVFTGTKNRTHEDISREIEKKGGILNAFTSQDMTSFWFKLPAEHIFSGLDIFTDMLNNPTFDKEKFEKEKRVILEEIKMYHDAPQRLIHDNIEANLYDKPFGESVIGSTETVSGLDRDFVVKYFKEHYDPSRFIVTIVGKADLDKVCSYLEENFKATEFKSKPKEIKKITKETVEERPGIDQAHFMWATHAPLANEKNYTVLEVLDAHLAHGMSSKLFLEIREKRGLAYAVKSYLSTEKHYSYYAIYAGTTKGAVPKVKELILQEIDNLQNMTEKDLEEAKELLIGLRKVQSEESISVMNELMIQELTGDAQEYYKHTERINGVTLSQVKELAKELKESYSTAAIIPK